MKPSHERNEMDGYTGIQPGNGNRKITLTMAIWNVRSRLQTGQMMKVANQIKKLNIDIRVLPAIVRFT
jgi:hypothetical protein